MISLSASNPNGLLDVLIPAGPPPRVSKHAKGRQPRRVNGKDQGGRQGRGAFGGGKEARARKAAFLAQSSEDAKKRANERSLKRLYAQWRENMSPEERAAARALKCLQPLADGGAPKARGGKEIDVEFRDPADLPEAADPRTAVDALEPKSPFSVAIENLDCAEITAAADCFGGGLAWALDVPDQRDLVQVGKNALAFIFLMRPDLVTGDERSLASGLLDYTAPKSLPAVPWGGECFQALATGDIFGRVLEWVRRGTTVSEIGERLCLVAYVVRPTMMGSPTLHQLGEVMNKTRQAKDKLAGCLRDTFAGIRAMAQRGEPTRDRCIASH